jgi:hypothetical protein
VRFVAAIDGLALLWLAWEIVFYAGEWPTGVRYDFPGMLAVAVFAGSVVSLAAPWLARDQAVGVPATVALVGAALLARYAVADPLFPIHHMAVVDVSSTTRFNDDLARSAQTAAAHAGWPIYVEAAFPSDYEKALTLPTWLRWKGFANPLFIRLHAWQPEGRAASDFERGLRSAMADVSAHGGHGYAPIDRVDPAEQAAGHCFTVSYSGPPEPPCAELTIRPW